MSYRIMLVILCFMCGVYWLSRIVSKSKRAEQNIDWELILCGMSFIMCGVNVGAIEYGMG